ncbi:MAG TPA: phospho-sugar mutase [Bacillota bacterium]|nr:phospho-sugar mutase [Bacillota bacterium]
MTSWKKVYDKWKSFPQLDPNLQQQLLEIEHDPAELEDAFYKELTFGTGGMRGVLGPGTNRMNIYTIRKAVFGLAEYLLEHRVNVKDRGVVISYDSRYQSFEFAVESAKVLAHFGIKAYVFESLRPTPLLSFAVRHLSTAAGIMITASHNPPEYNGFKVYNETGGQITPDEAEDIISCIRKVDNELTVPAMEQEVAEKEGLLRWAGKEVDTAYLSRLQFISKLADGEKQKEKDVSIVFTPLHGTSLDLVTKGLEQLRFTNVHVVEEQAVPDPEFRTVSSPNPEEHQAFSMAIELGEKVGADILLATDPDADRLGVAVKNKDGVYEVLTGNQLGSLMLYYILLHYNPIVTRNPRMIKTVVTTELGREIANSFGVKTIDTLTGFKFIGDKIRQFDWTGETFIFGYEESYGYLISGFVRDKDAVQSAVMAAEMAYYWKKQGKTLLDALQEVYEKYGYYREGLSSITLKGKDGAETISRIMENFRNEPFTEIAGWKVEKIENYLTGERKIVETNEVEPIGLPRENMVKILLEEKGWVCLRPSGTEPKLKYYYGVCGKDKVDSEERLARLKAEMDRLIESYQPKVRN